MAEVPVTALTRICKEKLKVHSLTQLTHSHHLRTYTRSLHLIPSPHQLDLTKFYDAKNKLLNVDTDAQARGQAGMLAQQLQRLAEENPLGYIYVLAPYVYTCVYVCV